MSQINIRATEDDTERKLTEVGQVDGFFFNPPFGYETAFSTKKVDPSCFGFDCPEYIVFDPSKNTLLQELGYGQTRDINVSFRYYEGNSDFFWIRVTGVNDDPVAVNDSFSVSEDGSKSFNPRGNDRDVDGPSLIIKDVYTTGTKGYAAENSSGTSINYNPQSYFQYLGVGETAIDSFQYDLFDGAGGTSNRATVSVSVIGQNDKPSAENDSVIVDADRYVNFGLLTNDSDPDRSDTIKIRSFDLEGTKGSFQINKTTGVVNYHPNGAFADLLVGETATEEFTYTIEDENGASDTAIAAITVKGTRVLSAEDDVVNTDEDTNIIIDVLANDSAAHTETLTITGLDLSQTDVPSPAFQLLDADGEVTYSDGGSSIRFNHVDFFNTLDAGETETVIFGYTISDGQGGESTADVTIRVDGINDAPVVVHDAFTTDEDTNITLNVLANDYDYESHSLRITGLNVDGLDIPSTAFQFLNADGNPSFADDATQIQFNHTNFYDYLDAGETAIAGFGYTVSDGQGRESTGEATVTITGINDRPIAESDQTETSSGAPVLIDVLANDFDFEGDDLFVRPVDPFSEKGASVLTKAGGILYNPRDEFKDLAPGETILDEFSYFVIDDSGLANRSTVVVEIFGVESNETEPEELASIDAPSFFAEDNFLF